MPCYDERSSPSYIAAEYREKVDRLTRVLCFVMNNLGSRESERLLSKNTELTEWWSEHQEWDRRRLQQEREARERKEAKKKAAAKLAAAERKILGIRDA